ncbi:uncharacterized protein [Rutidosis leptorrhynchoides]|uniref:uncharacterized protein n=1 Tax=Rutidosis leptorrhynchoides TaxID=125765 RepID=UPI003A98DF50
MRQKNITGYTSYRRSLEDDKITDVEEPLINENTIAEIHEKSKRKSSTINLAASEKKRSKRVVQDDFEEEEPIDLTKSSQEGPQFNISQDIPHNIFDKGFTPASPIMSVKFDHLHEHVNIDRETAADQLYKLGSAVPADVREEFEKFDDETMESARVQNLYAAVCFLVDDVPRRDKLVQELIAQEKALKQADNRIVRLEKENAKLKKELGTSQTALQSAEAQVTTLNTTLESQ